MRSWRTATLGLLILFGTCVLCEEFYDELGKVEFNAEVINKLIDKEANATLKGTSDTAVTEYDTQIDGVNVRIYTPSAAYYMFAFPPKSNTKRNILVYFRGSAFFMRVSVLLLFFQ